MKTKIRGRLTQCKIIETKDTMATTVRIDGMSAHHVCAVDREAFDGLALVTLGRSVVCELNQHGRVMKMELANPDLMDKALEVK